MKKLMRFALGVSALGTIFTICTYSPVFAAPRNGQLAPALKTVVTTGQTVALENYSGRVLVLDFFATWCQPCRQSIPHLVEMNNKYGRQGLQILGMSADDQGERKFSAFMSEQHISYPVAMADDKVLSDYGVRSVPVMYIVDKKGKIAGVYRGFNDEIARDSENVIKKLLAEK